MTVHPDVEALLGGLYQRAREAAAFACEQAGPGVALHQLVRDGKCDHSSEVQSAVAALLGVKELILAATDQLIRAIEANDPPIGTGTAREHRQLIEDQAAHRALLDLFNAINGHGRFANPAGKAA